MLGLSLVFIGVSVIPACAQRGKGIKLPKVPSKKPPMTGTTPAVVPATPCVPTTLQSAAVPTRAVVNETALNTAVERANGQWYPTQGKFQAEYVDRLIKSVTPSHLFEMEELVPRRSFWNADLWEDVLKYHTDFTKLITQDTPDLIPLGANINAELDTKKALSKFEQQNGYHIRNLGTKRRDLLVSAIKKIDEVFFTEHNGQMYVTKKALIKLHSYEQALIRLNYKVDSVFLKLNLCYLSELMKIRNQQILKALQGTQPQADVTTQRTAEEIQSLVENLDPQNPLRQAIEGTLKDNGYIAPAE